MHQRINWRALLTATALVASAALLLAAGTPTGKHPADKDWIIDVGPKACDLNEAGTPCGTQAISKGKQHKVVWRSKPAGGVLGIIIHVPPACPAPFKKMTQVGTDAQGNVLWAVDCKNGQCNSGPAVQGVCYQSYAYDQILGTEKCDGWIIVDK